MVLLDETVKDEWFVLDWGRLRGAVRRSRVCRSRRCLERAFAAACGEGCGKHQGGEQERSGSGHGRSGVAFQPVIGDFSRKG